MLQFKFTYFCYCQKWRNNNRKQHFIQSKNIYLSSNPKPLDFEINL